MSVTTFSCEAIKNGLVSCESHFSSTTATFVSTRQWKQVLCVVMSINVCVCLLRN